MKSNIDSDSKTDYFDDYDYKNQGKKITFKYVQNVEEKIFPWEIANFLSILNTTYYKDELLNSVCSALNNGIEGKNIFILDKSLPLNKSYGMLDLLNFNEKAIQYFYHIGLPWTLLPNLQIMTVNCAYRIFNKTNSILHLNRRKPIYSAVISRLFENNKYDINVFVKNLYSIVKSKFKDKPERFIQYLAQIRKVVEVCETDIKNVKWLTTQSDKKLLSLLENNEYKHFHMYLNMFFSALTRNERPIVGVFVDEENIRILGRSLVNKKEKNVYGLELKQIVRNSPIGSFLEGGAAIYRTLKDEKRKEELHELDMIKKEKEIELIDNEIIKSKQEIILNRIRIEKELNDLVDDSDVNAIDHIKDGYAKTRLLEAYQKEATSRHSRVNRLGLRLDSDSINILAV